MARLAKLSIEESVRDLRTLLKRQSNHKNISRLQTLIYIQENRFKTREELSEHIGVNRRTVERWLSDYRLGGLDMMLVTGKRNRRSSLIPDHIHEALEQRVMDRELGFSSYIEAKRWVASEYGLELKYNTIREHLIRHFKTKIKRPRRSHIKKDAEATEVFLKTTQYAGKH